MLAPSGLALPNSFKGTYLIVFLFNVFSFSLHRCSSSIIPHPALSKLYNHQGILSTAPGRNSRLLLQLAKVVTEMQRMRNPPSGLGFVLGGLNFGRSAVSEPNGVKNEFR
jgi:hypothetical protein